MLAICWFKSSLSYLLDGRDIIYFTFSYIALYPLCFSVAVLTHFVAQAITQYFADPTWIEFLISTAPMWAKASDNLSFIQPIYHTLFESLTKTQLVAHPAFDNSIERCTIFDATRPHFIFDNGGEAYYVYDTPETGYICGNSVIFDYTNFEFKAILREQVRWRDAIPSTHDMKVFTLWCFYVHFIFARNPLPDFVLILFR